MPVHVTASDGNGLLAANAQGIADVVEELIARQYAQRYRALPQSLPSQFGDLHTPENLTRSTRSSSRIARRTFFASCQRVRPPRVQRLGGFGIRGNFNVGENSSIRRSSCMRTQGPLRLRSGQALDSARDHKVSHRDATIRRERDGRIGLQRRGRAAPKGCRCRARCRAADGRGRARPG